MGARTNLILVTIDCMRADFLDHTNARYINDLARNGATYTNAYANGCGTPDSFPAILAGRTARPFAHRENVDVDREYSLDPEDVTLAEVLSNAGYDTAAFVGGNPYLGRRYGYDRGFSVFNDHQPGSLVDRFSGSRVRGALRMMASHLPWSPYPGANQITLAAMEWLANRDSAKPYFLWTHYMDAHFPTLPPGHRSFKDRQAAWAPMRGKPTEHHDLLLDLYRTSIKHVDFNLGSLFSMVSDDTVVAVTSDHGQLFGEHCSYWHNGVWEQLLRVPLVIAGPGVAPGVLEHNAQLLDLPPYLADLVQVEKPVTWQGNDLTEETAPIYAVSNNPAGHAVTEAFIEPVWKVVRAGDSEWRYERANEPADMVLQ